MGKVLGLVKSYNEGKLTFEALKAKLVTFPWRDLEWPEIFERASTMTEGAMLLDEHGDMGFPEEDTIEELDAAWLDDLLTDEEDDELYKAIWEAHQNGQASQAHPPDSSQSEG